VQHLTENQWSAVTVAGCVMMTITCFSCLLGSRKVTVEVKLYKKKNDIFSIPMHFYKHAAMAGTLSKCGTGKEIVFIVFYEV
jgi:hypothetical protein